MYIKMNEIISADSWVPGLSDDQLGRWLTSHQYGPGLIPALSAICALRLL